MNRRVVDRVDLVSRLVVVVAGLWLFQLLFHEALHLLFALLSPLEAASAIVLNPLRSQSVCDGAPGCVPMALTQPGAFDHHIIIYPAQYVAALVLAWGFSYWFRPSVSPS